MTGLKHAISFLTIEMKRTAECLMLSMTSLTIFKGFFMPINKRFCE